MREEEFVFDKGFTTGLRKEENNPLNQQALVTLENARVTPAGLLPYEDAVLPYNWLVYDSNPAHPTPLDVVVDWPFPQWFHAGTDPVLAHRYTMDTINANGTFNNQVVFGHGVVSDDLWTMADFHLFKVMAKDGTFIEFRDTVAANWKFHQPHASIPYCNSIMNLNGQLVAGGLANWGNWTDVTTNYIAWGKIGEAKFALDRMNESGYRRMDWIGSVLTVKQLGNMAVVYGDNGMSVIKPVASPAATFGLKNLLSIGLRAKGAVAGDEHQHCFVGSDNYLYRITADLKLEKLGYQEYMEGLDDNLIMSFNSGRQEFHISDETTCYLMSPYGLSGVHQRPTSLFYNAGTLEGVFLDGVDPEFNMLTDRIDLGVRGRKTIQSIELGCQGTGTFSVAVDYRDDSSAAFGQTDFVEVNNHKQVHLPISGTEFRVAVKCTEYEDTQLSYVKVKFKYDDLRNTRGERR